MVGAFGIGRRPLNERCLIHDLRLQLSDMEWSRLPTLFRGVPGWMFRGQQAGEGGPIRAFVRVFSDDAPGRWSRW